MHLTGIVVLVTVTVSLIGSLSSRKAGYDHETPVSAADAAADFGFLRDHLNKINPQGKESGYPLTRNPGCSHILCRFVVMLNSGTLKPAMQGIAMMPWITSTFGLYSRFFRDSGFDIMGFDYRDLVDYEGEKYPYSHYSKLNLLFSVLSDCNYELFPNCREKRRNFVNGTNALIEESGMKYEKMYNEQIGMYQLYLQL